VKTECGTDIEKSLSLLNAGDIVAVPTETVYGLAANALNAEAVAKIFEAKQRPTFDPLIVHIPSFQKLFDLVTEIPDSAHRLAEAFWPGPLTMVLPKKSTIPDVVTSGLATCGFRVPAHPMMQKLLSALSFPLAAPSANLFEKTSPTRAEHVMEQLQGRIPYILDGGACTIGLESTIVGFDDDENPVIYRLGGIETEAIRAVMPHTTVSLAVSGNPKAPGMLSSHYAPGKLLYFGTEQELLQYTDKPYACISLKTCSLTEKSVFNGSLTVNGNLRTAAANFFQTLHRADHSDAQIILVVKFPETGLGLALNDRAKRAGVK
jgi:L-threonylcarbamoyladenylate synthase